MRGLNLIIGLGIMFLLVGCNFEYPKKNSIYCSDCKEKCNGKLDVALACEDGCVMAYDKNLNDSLKDEMDKDYNISRNIIDCIIECNNKYYYEFS